MPNVSEDGKGRKPRYNKDIELIQQFHDGPLKRCSQCGRLIFHPCLACEIERGGHVSAPADGRPPEPDDMHIELQDNERQRYEYFRAQKMREEIVKEKTDML